MSVLFNTSMQEPLAKRPLWLILTGLLLVAATVSGLLIDRLEQINAVDLLYMVPVIFASLFLGMQYGAAVAVLAVFAYDYFFIHPKFEISALTSEDMIRLVIFLLVAGVSSVLVNILHRKALLLNRLHFDLAAKQTLLEDRAMQYSPDFAELRAAFAGLYDQFPCGVLWIREDKLQSVNLTASMWLGEDVVLLLASINARTADNFLHECRDGSRYCIQVAPVQPGIHAAGILATLSRLPVQ